MRRGEGGSSCAFYLRDENGDVLFAKEEPQNCEYSMEEEANAFLYAAKHCSQSQHNKIIFQMDSLLMQKVLTNEWHCPWKIANTVKQIHRFMQYKQV